MKSSIKTIALTAISVVVIGCGSTLPPLPTLPSVNLTSIDGFSEQDLKVNSNNIIVAPGIKSDIPEFVQGYFANEMTTIIIDSGSEVIDRKLASRFIDEIQLKENLSENYNAYQGPVEAKFVVIPTVTDMSFGGEYEKSYTTKNKKGETKRHPAECDYSAKVKGNIQIRELPSMRQVVSFNVKGRSSSSKENPPSSSCKEQSMYNGVVAGAIADLLEKGDDDYMTLSKYVGSRGLITGAKAYNGKLYFETNLGRLNGAKEDAPIAIYQMIDGEMVMIAEGEMMGAKNVFSKKSYVEVDSDVAPLIKRGMIVMLSGKCESYICSLNSSIKSMTN